MGRRLSSYNKALAFEEPQVNLTPLIDVVFVILIMFIVVAPLLELDRVDLADAPQGGVEGVKAVQETSPIAIYVHKDNKVTLNNKPTTLNELATQLKMAKKKYPKVRPQLFHDRKAHFGTYQAVKNAAEEAGFQQMDIVLKP